MTALYDFSKWYIRRWPTEPLKNFLLIPFLPLVLTAVAVYNFIAVFFYLCDMLGHVTSATGDWLFTSGKSWQELYIEKRDWVHPGELFLAEARARRNKEEKHGANKEDEA